MKHLFWAAAFLFVSVAAFAQKVEFEANAPAVVAVGEAFRIEFSLNAKPEEFVPPTFDGFDVVAGPTLSEGTSVSIVNGNVTKTSSFTYTYVIQASSVGKASISAASVRVDGKSYGTQPLTIEVIADEASVRPGAGGGEKQAGEARSAKLGADDLLVGCGQPQQRIQRTADQATFIYARVQLGGLDNKVSGIQRFLVQDLDAGIRLAAGDVEQESVRRQDYPGSCSIRSRPGRHIEQFSLNAVAQIVMQTSPRGQSLFDDFFGGGQTVQEVRKNLSTAPVAITVKDFPAGAPASFNGAVGQFQMSGGIDKKTMSANASDNFTLKISGSGNLPLIQAPTVEMPTSFEQYNKKTTESLAHNANGITGYRQFEYPFIPRAEGSYTINPVEFSYFDPDAAKYVTLNTSSFNIEVRPDSTGGGGVSGIVSGINKEDLKILDKDIRFIRIGDPCLTRRGNLLFGSTAYFAALALILLVFAGGYLYLKKRLSEMQNTVLVRNRKANKVALQRLRAAFQHMNAGSEKAFYEEMLKALWGYMSDKLNIPVANLTKDNIREELLKRNVSAELTGQLSIRSPTASMRSIRRRPRGG
ncbi:MAG: BatD family protein [Alistipes sp.]